MTRRKLLAASLAGGENHARHGSWLAVLGWFVASWVVAGLSIGPLAPLLAFRCLVVLERH